MTTRLKRINGEQAEALNEASQFLSKLNREGKQIFEVICMDYGVQCEYQIYYEE